MKSTPAVEIVIPELTDEMRATFPAFVDEWVAIGLSTEPMDRGAAAAGMATAYAVAGLPAPKVFYSASPLGGAITRELILQGLDSVGDSVRDSVRASVWDSVWASVGDSVRDSVGASVRDSVWASVRASVWASVGDSVWASVGASVGDSVWDSVRASVGASVWASVGDSVWASVGDSVMAGWPKGIFYGNHEPWLSYIDWFRRHGLGEIARPLDGLTLVARSAGWCWLHRGFVVISDRPAELHDEVVTGRRRRLHNASGPSVRYRDGWCVWHWHGQRVPQWVIESPSIAKIAAETNTEVRRCAIESLGWPKYLKALKLKPVHVEADPGNPGFKLQLFDVPGARTLYNAEVRLLVMQNASRDRDGTRRTFAETVPATCKTAGEAAAWQFGVDVTDYRLLARAT